MEPETLATIDDSLTVFRLMQTVTELRRALAAEREAGQMICRALIQAEAKIETQREIIEMAKSQARGIRRFIVSQAFIE